MPSVVSQKPRLVLFLICLLLFLPGFFNLGPADRDESRFAQASKQMLETGNFVEIYFQEDARNKKPIGIYWLQAGSAALFGGSEAPIWAYRLPSLVGAIGAVLMTYWAGLRLIGPVGAFTASLALAGSLLLVIEAHLAKTDAMLLFTIVTAQACLALMYVSGNRRAIGGEQFDPKTVALLFWVAIGASILIKGPIGVMVAGLTILALAIADRSIRWLYPIRPLIGILIVLIITAPWVIAISLTSGSTFFADAVGDDLLPKLLSGQESHGSPPGTYTLIAVVLLWPASIVLGPALLFAWRRRAEPIYRFCLAWVVPSWILFELVPTKLPHYVMPLAPAIALIIGGYFATLAERGQHVGAPWFTRFAWICWLMVSVALLATPVGAAIYLGTLPPVTALICLALALLLLLSIRPNVPVPAPGSGLWRPIAAAFLLYVATFQITLPNLHDLNLSRQIHMAATAAHGPNVQLASTGYAEPSLVFLAGTNTRLMPPGSTAHFLARNPRAIAVVEKRQEEAFREKATELGLTLRTVSTLSGYNYSIGKDVTFTLFESGGARANR